MLKMVPFLNHKYFEVVTLGQPFGALLKGWTDEEHLQFHHDSLAYYEFVVEFLTANNGAMARVIDTEPRQMEYLIQTIENQKDSIKHDAQYRKARAYCRQKEAKENAGKPTEPLPDGVFTIGTDLTSDVILSFKYN